MKIQVGCFSNSEFLVKPLASKKTKTTTTTTKQNRTKQNKNGIETQVRLTNILPIKPYNKQQKTSTYHVL